MLAHQFFWLWSKTQIICKSVLWTYSAAAGEVYNNLNNQLDVLLTIAEEEPGLFIQEIYPETAFVEVVCIYFAWTYKHLKQIHPGSEVLLNSFYFKFHLKV